MPWPVYSEQFVMSSQTSTWAYFTVPAGMRAVATDVFATNSGAVENMALVSLRDYWAWIAVIPAASGFKAATFRLVAYQGERLGIYMQSSGGMMGLSGYLFADNSGRYGPPAGAAQEPVLPDPPVPPQLQEAA